MMFFSFFFIFIDMSIFNRAYADLMLTDNVGKKIMDGDVDNVDRSTLRDPTRPLSYVNKKSVIAKPLTLQAIFVRSNNRSAVINGQHVNVGDVVSNHRVVAIGEKVVRLEKNNKKFLLSLRDGMRDVRP